MLGKTNAKVSNMVPSENLNISLLTNQSSHGDLVGAVFNVSYEDFSEDYVYEGKEVTVKVPAGMEYTVSFGEVEGYSVPSSVTYTAEEKNSRDVVGMYNTEVVTVSVSADDGESISAEITIDGVTYAGSSAVHKVAYGKDYEVVFGEVSGYTAPASQSFVGESPSREVNVVYLASSLVVNVLSNQPDDLLIADVKATVSYGDVSMEVANGAKVNVPVDSEVTVSFPEVDGYRKPGDIVYTHAGGSVVKSGTYETELVTVNVSADQGAVSGFEVTVKDSSTGAVIGSQTTATETYKIPFGVSYSVSAGNVEGYVSPTVQSFVAAQDSRVVNMVFKYHAGTKNPVNGVWIQDTDGYCHTESEWTGEYTPNGIAVVTSNCSFVMALKESYGTYVQWSSNNYMAVNGITTTTVQSVAMTDYDGEKQTGIIMDELGVETYQAACRCHVYKFPNGKNGYLGAMGEWQAVLSNINTVRSALNKCGGTALDDGYWTSTQYNYANAWYINFQYKVIGEDDKSVSRPNRAFCSL